MPTYSFRNKKTDEEFTVTMRMADREPYLDANPDLEQIFTTPIAIGDPVRLGVTKVRHSNFQNKLKDIKHKHPRSTIDTGNVVEV